jgi:hypothetical protein
MVIVVPSVPAKVSEALEAKVLPSAIVSVAELAGAVIVSLLIVVAVAAPSVGVTSVGDVARTILPVPVEETHSGAVAPALTWRTCVAEPIPRKVVVPEAEL